MKLLIVFTTLLLAVNVLCEKSQWEIFKVKYGKSYPNPVEELHRYSIFLNNSKTIAEHNAKYEAGLATYTMGINQFADLTQEEFKEKFGFQIKHKPQIRGRRLKFSTGATIPDSIDWRETGAVLDVKDQGKHKGAWAFSATGALEGQNYIVNNVSISLSEQELLDCIPTYGMEGSGLGSDASGAFWYVKNHGIESEHDYPYKGTKLSCSSNEDKKVLKITDFNFIAQFEEDLLNAVGTIGPISAAINVDLLHSYSGGIFNDKNCPNHETSAKHGVLVVGYGEENGTPYWIIKNSWGTNWGENGYLRLERNHNLCGINWMGSYPIL